MILLVLSILRCSVSLVLLLSVPAIVWGVIDVTEVGIVEVGSLGWPVVVTAGNSVIEVVVVSVSSVGEDSWSNGLKSVSAGGTLLSGASPLASVPVVVVGVVSVELVWALAGAVTVVGGEPVDNEVVGVVHAVEVLPWAVIQPWSVVVVSWEIVLVTACSHVGFVVPHGLVVLVGAEAWSVGGGSFLLVLGSIPSLWVVGLLEGRGLGEGSGGSKGNSLEHIV